jgi:hypothetical protein
MMILKVHPGGIFTLFNSFHLYTYTYKSPLWNSEEIMIRIDAHPTQSNSMLASMPTTEHAKVMNCILKCADKSLAGAMEVLPDLLGPSYLVGRTGHTIFIKNAPSTDLAEDQKLQLIDLEDTGLAKGGLSEQLQAECKALGLK